MRQLSQLLFGTVLALVFLQPLATATAATVYNVSVDTTSLFGTTGYLDLQFNPGGVSAPAATATLNGFFGDITLGGLATNDGSMSGVLPGSLVFNNDTAFNAVLQPSAFGNVFGFTISFSGAYETALSGSGTRFSLAVLDDNFDPLATVDPVGTILQFELAPGGAVTATTFNADVFGAESIVTLTAVPVPAALPLLASAFALFGFARRRQV